MIKAGMDNIPKVNELSEIYTEMDQDNRNKMVAAAAELLHVQQTLANTISTSSRSRLKQKRRLGPIPGFLITGPLLVFAAYVFWITLIVPALII